MEFRRRNFGGLGLAIWVYGSGSRWLASWGLRVWVKGCRCRSSGFRSLGFRAYGLGASGMWFGARVAMRVLDGQPLGVTEASGHRQLYIPGRYPPTVNPKTLNRQTQNP